MDINTIAGIITAATTVGTVVVALWQFKKTVVNEEQMRQENIAREEKQNAYLVDAWIVIDTKDNNYQHIVINNGSSGAIRNVSLEVQWNGLTDKETVPGFEQGWRLIPPGR